MAKKKGKDLNYKDAISELQNILAKLQDEETSIDDLVKEVKRAQELVKYCKDVLRSTETDLEKILGE